TSTTIFIPPDAKREDGSPTFPSIFWLGCHMYRVQWDAGTMRVPGLLCCFRNRVDRHVSAAVGFRAERHRTMSERKQGVILAHAYIGTWVPFCTALTHDDVASEHSFATKLFHAKAFGF